ncbi:MAG: Re/Si-specific NAD(P)(+) transhydrogenase subunit alpha [Gammaproteobacteria bacterium]
MIIGVLKEVLENENRVSITPDIVIKFIKLGYSVLVQSKAGLKSNFTDDQYVESGASITEDTNEIWSSADIILKINAPSEDMPDETAALVGSKTLVSFFGPAQHTSKLKKMAVENVNVLAMDCVPRISRAQKMDALSSMANVAGSRAVIEASFKFGRFFGGQITAAGKIPPAKVLIIGAGVAGLSAIGTSVSLGAIVRAFDTRPEVKEQVESLNAEFLTIDVNEDGSGSGGYAKEMSKDFLKAEHELFKSQCKDVDIIITTALIPGKEAPKLITEDMIEVMKPGSVIVDLAAQQGGNCAYTQRDKCVVQGGVTIIGYTDLPSRLASQSSKLYATNLYHVIHDLTPNKDGEAQINMEDEVIRGMTIIRNGKITYPPPKIEPPKPKTITKSEPKNVIPEKKGTTKQVFPVMPFLISLVLLIGVGSSAPASFMAHFTVFVLSCFIGYMVVWNVTASLHTPLMSVTNAVSSIIIIGALIQVSSDNILLVIMSSLAILIASINIVGGFAVTKRMLDMFRK